MLLTVLDTITICQPAPFDFKSDWRKGIPFNWKGIMFLPIYNTSTYEIRYYQGEIGNLTLKLTPDYLYTVNSWHKYCHGNNYCDYFISDIENTYDMLKERLGESFTESKIKKVSYGCVIEADPYLNFPYWNFFKTKEPIPMLTKTGFKYGAAFKFTDFTLKGYDKTKEVYLHNKIRLEKQFFRVECEVKYMRHLTKRVNPIFINSPKDLFNLEVAQYLANDLIIKYNTIEKEINLDFNSFSTFDLGIIGMMKHSPIRTHLRRERNRTYKRYKARLSKIILESENDYFDKIGDQITDKMFNLING